MTLIIALLALSLATLYAGKLVPPGALRCVLVPVSSATCRNEGGAGIRELYLIDTADITGVTFDGTTNELITANTIDGGAAWAQFQFENDTAFFNQEKQLAGRTNLNFAQTISANFPNNDYSIRAALRAADQCCNLAAIVVDNQGQQRVVGILPRYNQAGDAIIGHFSTGLKTGAGSYNTGADSAADENIRTFTLVANSPKEACYTSLDVTAISLL